MIDLKLHELALRLRWEWLRRTDYSRPWQGLPLCLDPQVLGVYDSLVHWQLGAGDKILFWKDRWINGANVKEIAPLVVAAVRTQVVNRRTVRDGLLNHRWASDVVGDLSADGMVQLVRIWELMIEVDLVPMQAGKVIWKWQENGPYSAASTYKVLTEGAIRVAYDKAIWKCWAPLSCKIFMWLAIQYRVWTSDRRLRHGLQEESSTCFFCDQEEDAVDHILLGCVYARQVWMECFSRARIQLDLMPLPTDRLEQWWCMTRQRV